MTREQIEKAVNDYIGYEPEIDEGIYVTMRRNAFKSGANWRINSVWHNISEAPEKGRYIAVLFKSKDITLWYVTDNIMQVLKAHKVIMWAYTSDLVPELHEE